jgi:hypothetical protein
VKSRKEWRKGKNGKKIKTGKKERLEIRIR